MSYNSPKSREPFSVAFPRILQRLEKICDATTADYFAVHTENSYQRLLLHSAADAIPGWTTVSLNQPDRVSVCSRHHCMLVESGEPCCGDLKCHGKCPQRDDDCLYKDVDTKLKRVYVLRSAKKMSKNEARSVIEAPGVHVSHWCVNFEAGMRN